jgi:dCMP deaminase
MIMSKIGQYVMELQEKEEYMGEYEFYEDYMRRMNKEVEDNITKWDRRFMEQAELIASWSKDPSSKIGAVIVNDERRILATGYNGFPRGISDTPERLNSREEKYPRIIHAEMNALMNALYNGVAVKDATLYVYGLPICPSCTKCIIQAGIKRVVIPSTKTDKGNWQEIWEEQSSLMFKESGVQITLLEV